MIWHSWADFFAMGGYGFYVWGSVVVTLAAMIGELVFLRLRRLSALRVIRGLVRAEHWKNRENKA